MSGWAEFRTSVASRLASLFLFDGTGKSGGEIRKHALHCGSSQCEYILIPLGMVGQREGEAGGTVMREVQCDFMRHNRSHNRSHTKDLCPGEIHEDELPLQQQILFSHNNELVELCFYHHQPTFWPD